MKRIIPFLFLAVAFGACQDSPTVPSDGPLLKVDCSDPKFQDHPQCDGEPEPADLYSPTDLAICSRCDGGAHDISEPQATELHVVGWIDEPMGWPPIAVVWTGTVENIGDATWVTLNTPGYPGPGSGSPGIALGINDNSTSIVGWNYVYGEPRVPVIWQADGAGGWLVGQVLDHLELTYTGGNARDVNIAGKIAGRLTSETDTVAVTWASSQVSPILLETDAGHRSAALGLNNDGDVVGRMWDEQGLEQAMLWTSGGDVCRLNPDGDQSVAVRVDDRHAGTVLVAGQVAPFGQPTQPAIWAVEVATCAHTPRVIAGAGWANDVRSSLNGWEAVGVDETGRDERPMVWFGLTESELLHGKFGTAYVISSGNGHIVGRRTHRGHVIPVLWTK